MLNDDYKEMLSCFSDEKVEYLLVGAHALAVHGHPRATKDVDFLVGDEAFQVHEGGLVTMSAGVPIQVGDVPVDALSIRPEERHLLDALLG